MDTSTSDVVKRFPCSMVRNRLSLIIKAAIKSIDDGEAFTKTQEIIAELISDYDINTSDFPEYITTIFTPETKPDVALKYIKKILPIFTQEAIDEMREQSRKPISEVQYTGGPMVLFNRSNNTPCEMTIHCTELFCTELLNTVVKNDDFKPTDFTNVKYIPIWFLIANYFILAENDMKYLLRNKNSEKVKTEKSPKGKGDSKSDDTENNNDTDENGTDNN